MSSHFFHLLPYPEPRLVPCAVPTFCIGLASFVRGVLLVLRTTPHLGSYPSRADDPPRHSCEGGAHDRTAGRTCVCVDRRTVLHGDRRVGVRVPALVLLDARAV